MTTSREQSKIQAPTTDDSIPAWQVKYVCANLQRKLYTKVLETFADQASKGRINKARLAKRLEKRPEQITRWLSGPNNWTIDTVVMLLFGMGAELDPQVLTMGERKPNYVHPLAAMLNPSLAQTTAPLQVRPSIDSPAEKTITIGPPPLQRDGGSNQFSRKLVNA